MVGERANLNSSQSTSDRNGQYNVCSKIRATGELYQNFDSSHEKIILIKDKGTISMNIANLSRDERAYAVFDVINV